MTGLDEALERLVTDPAFRRRLAADPAGALAGYELTDDDRALLASQVSDAPGVSGALDGRASKASLAGMMGAVGELAESFSGSAAEMPVPSSGDGVKQIDILSMPPAPNESSFEEHINLESFAPGVEPAAADSYPLETVSFVYGQIDVQASGGAVVTESLEINHAGLEPAAPGGDISTEEITLTHERIEPPAPETGPIADVLDSAAGSAAGSAGVGDPSGPGFSSPTAYTYDHASAETSAQAPAHPYISHDSGATWDMPLPAGGSEAPTEPTSLGVETGSDETLPAIIPIHENVGISEFVEQVSPASSEASTGQPLTENSESVNVAGVQYDGSTGDPATLSDTPDPAKELYDYPGHYADRFDGVSAGEAPSATPTVGGSPRMPIVGDWEGDDAGHQDQAGRGLNWHLQETFITTYSGAGAAEEAGGVGGADAIASPGSGSDPAADVGGGILNVSDSTVTLTSPTIPSSSVPPTGGWPSMPIVGDWDGDDPTTASDAVLPPSPEAAKPPFIEDVLISSYTSGDPPHDAPTGGMDSVAPNAAAPEPGVPYQQVPFEKVITTGLITHEGDADGAAPASEPSGPSASGLEDVVVTKEVDSTDVSPVAPDTVSANPDPMPAAEPEPQAEARSERPTNAVPDVAESGSQTAPTG